MSKPDSGLFTGTQGIRDFYGDAENIIAARVSDLDLREHPAPLKQLGKKARRKIDEKIGQRTATREEWKRRDWDRRFRRRRERGIRRFWKKERDRILVGKTGTRNWSHEQRRSILMHKKPMFKGRPLQSHHAYSTTLYPHLADRAEVIYPATHLEHRMGWHGGSYKKAYQENACDR